jgi:hypothetical protein
MVSATRSPLGYQASIIIHPSVFHSTRVQDSVKFHPALVHTYSLGKFQDLDPKCSRRIVERRVPSRSPGITGCCFFPVSMPKTSPGTAFEHGQVYAILIFPLCWHPSIAIHLSFASPMYLSQLLHVGMIPNIGRPRWRGIRYSGLGQGCTGSNT